MIWFGVEPEVPRHANRTLQLAAASKIPLVSRHITRRLTDDDQLDAVVHAVSEPTDSRQQMLLGMRDGLEGRYDVKAPAAWTDVYATLRAAGGDTAKLALQISQQFGDTVAAEALLETLQNDSAELDDRLDALEGLTGRKRPELKPVLLTLLSDDVLRKHAIRSMAAFDDADISDALLTQYSAFSDEDKLEAVNTLASRGESGRRLTQAIANGTIPRRDIPAWVARLLRRVVGNSFIDVWGALDELTADKEAQLAKYRTLLSGDALSSADATHGRQLFKRTCAACHKLHGYGGIIGPDITGANRGNLEYLLGNILTPSAEIQDAYRMHIVVTDDGRVWSGIPAEDNDRQLRLRIANQEKPVIINKSEIESRDIAPVSMMPEGQLTTMTDKEVLDLIAYLQTQRQVELPEDHDHGH